MTGADRAHAAGRAGIVAGATGDRNARLHAPFRRQLGAQRACSCACPRPATASAFHQGMSQPADLAGPPPPPLADIEARRCRPSPDISGNVFASQARAAGNFGQQHLRHLVENSGFVVLHPCQFRRGEARKDDVAGQRPEAWVGIERGGFRMAARVVPQGCTGAAPGLRHRVAWRHACGRTDRCL